MNKDRTHTIKFFFKRLLFFFLPWVITGMILLIYAELTLYYYPSTFQRKAQFIKENKDSIEVLILGSSHNQSAINPEYIDNFKVSNLAFGGQNLAIDSAMLNKKINDLPNLKTVILELSYHSLEHRYRADYHRNSLYLRYYDINLFGRRNTPLDYSIYLSKPKLYSQFLKPWVKKTPVNKFGYAIQLSVNDTHLHRFKNLSYNVDSIMKDTNNRLITRHRNENLDAYNSNTTVLSGMIDLCITNDVVPVIILTPVFKNYYNSYLVGKEQRRKSYLKYLLERYPQLVVLDYEQSSKIVVTDFKNEDHLNPQGAEKFSKILKKELETIVGK